MNQDIRQSKPRLREELVFWPDRAGDCGGYRIEVPSRCKFFRIGYTEFVFIHSLDGKNSVAQACGLTAKKLSRDAISPTEADSIVRWLMQNNLVEGVIPSSPVKDKTSLKQKSWLDRLNPFWLNIPLPDVQRLIRPLASPAQVLFSVPVVMLACVTMLVATISIGVQSERFIASSTAIFSSGRWIGLMASWTLLKLLHELGHAAAAARYGCPIHKAGIALVLFAPLPYVDVTASLRLRSRWQRIVIAAAGMYFELTIAAIAAIVWCWVDSPAASHLLFNVIVTASVASIVFNANPLMRFDSYYILVDLLRIPNLATDGSQAVSALASRWFYARSTNDGEWTGWRRPFIISYGIAALLWRVVVCVSLSLAAMWMFAGAGVFLIVIGVFTWIGRPSIARLKSWERRRRLDPAAALRAAVITCGLMIGGGWLMFGVPISTGIRAPAVIDSPQGAVLRCKADGFVRAIVLQDGDYVDVGDAILQLENDDLFERRRTLQAEIAQNRIRQRQATESRDIASSQVQRSDRQTLESQLAQVNAQIDGLTVRAHCRGRIIAPRIGDLSGTYVHEGDELLTVSDNRARRAVALIAGADIRQASAMIGQSVRVRAVSGHSTAGTLESIKPLASSHLRYDSLASTNGGELSVRIESDTDDGNRGFELLEPRFEATIRLAKNADSPLPLGQTVRVAVGWRSMTVASRLRVWIDRLLRDAEAVAQASNV